EPSGETWFLSENHRCQQGATLHPLLRLRTESWPLGPPWSAVPDLTFPPVPTGVMCSSTLKWLNWMIMHYEFEWTFSLQCVCLIISASAFVTGFKRGAGSRYARAHHSEFAVGMRVQVQVQVRTQDRSGPTPVQLETEPRSLLRPDALPDRQKGGRAPPSPF
ncbi:hypothetical protein ANANG_G00184920, partial [Anguilla anguilla]